MNGMMLIPLIALIFFIVSFFAKVPGGVKWAGFVLIAVIVQVTLGLFGHEAASLGILHGLNALLLFSLAVMAGKRAGTASSSPHPEAQRLPPRSEPFRNIGLRISTVKPRRGLVLAAVATAVIVVPLGWLWWSSLLPDERSVHRRWGTWTTAVGRPATRKPDTWSLMRSASPT